MSGEAIDFKIDGKYHYVSLSIPKPAVNGGFTPTVFGKEFQCILRRQEHVGLRFLFIDEEKKVYFCRRMPFRQPGFFSEKNLIEVRDREIGDLAYLYAPIQEVESMFRALLVKPKDAQHKLFCERAIADIEKIKQNFGIA